MDTKLMALLAHRAAIEEIAELQQRHVQQKAVNDAFQEAALPVLPFMRRLDPRQQTMRRADELVDKQMRSDQERLERLMKLVIEIEDTFKAFHEADDEAWATGLADYLRRSRGA